MAMTESTPGPQARSDVRWRVPAYLSPSIDMHTHPPYDRSQTEPMLAAARRAGIERLIMCSIGYSDMIPYPSVDEVRRGNEEVYKLIDGHPGFVFGLVYVNPNHSETRDILEEGLQHPSCEMAGGRPAGACARLLERGPDQERGAFLTGRRRAAAAGALPAQAKQPQDALGLADVPDVAGALARQRLRRELAY